MMRTSLIPIADLGLGDQVFDSRRILRQVRLIGRSCAGRPGHTMVHLGTIEEKRVYYVPNDHWVEVLD